jgi:quercetin dioxygenase-like cupin family protein
MPNDIHLLPDSQSEKLNFDWGHLTWFANRQLGNSEEMTVGRCVLKAGQSNPRHYHPNCSEILVVIAGRIRHTIEGGQEAEMGPGDTVTVLKNTWHRATNIGDGEAVLFIAFSSADRETIGE